MEDLFSRRQPTRSADTREAEAATLPETALDIRTVNGFADRVKQEPPAGGS